MRSHSLLLPLPQPDVCSCEAGYSGDDCSFICGNGILEGIVEQCDDGNTDGLDGCSGMCLCTNGAAQSTLPLIALSLHF